MDMEEIKRKITAEETPPESLPDVRFVKHSTSPNLWYAMGFLIVAAVFCLLQRDIMFNLLGVAFAVAAVIWFRWSRNNRDDIDNKLYPLNLFKYAAERQFCDMENKLINLMCQSPNIPERFRDGFVKVQCTELDERRVSFMLTVYDVVGAIEFIEKNADKWAAAFGDRDGADIKTIATGCYILEFDLLGSAAADVSVEW